MGAGTLALTFAWLLLGQGSNELVYTKDRELTIPINLNPAMRSECRELLLYASLDQGATYQQVASVLPDKTEFVFRSPNDGLFWLKSAVINRQGRQEPENIQQAKPDLKIMIDSMKPVVKTFAAQRQGDDVVVVWEILEDHFDPQGLMLEYQVKGLQTPFWTKIPVTGALTGQKIFHPTGAGPLVVRLFAKDQAGNQSVMTAEVAGSVSVAAYNPPPMPIPAATGQLAEPMPPPVPPPGSIFNPPPVIPEPLKQPPPVANQWTPPGPPIGGVSTQPMERMVATSDRPPEPAPAPAHQPSVMPVSVPQRPALPPLHYVNQTKVELEYACTKVGKSGLGSVELYLTTDDGQHWNPYAKVPYDEVKNFNQRLQETRDVDLPGEGIYGFTIVVKSKAGLGKAPPKPGDLPELRFEVDTTPPHAELFIAGPDPNRPNHLVLKWTARDKNLHANPITLEWAEPAPGPGGRAGEWKKIVTGHPNTPDYYSWELPDNIPVQVYLRLKVRDLAGNETIVATQDAELVDLAEPEGKLLNVTVPSRVP